MNDFAANGYGIFNMKSEDYEVFHKGTAEEGRPIAVIGAGTGLGEGYLTKSPGNENYDVWANEGGHGDFAIRNQRDFDLMNFAKDFIKR